jgi:hypothetical protein
LRFLSFFQSLNGWFFFFDAPKRWYSSSFFPHLLFSGIPSQQPIALDPARLWVGLLTATDVPQKLEQTFFV